MNTPNSDIGSKSLGGNKSAVDVAEDETGSYDDSAEIEGSAGANRVGVSSSTATSDPFTSITSGSK